MVLSNSNWIASNLYILLRQMPQGCVTVKIYQYRYVQTYFRNDYVGNWGWALCILVLTWQFIFANHVLGKWRPWNPLKIPSLHGYNGFSIYSLVCTTYSCNLRAFSKFVRVNISFQWVHYPPLLVLSFDGAYNTYLPWTYYSVSFISNDINISNIS